MPDYEDVPADALEPETAVSAVNPGKLPPWSQVWQLPLLLFAIGFFAIAIWLAMPQGQVDDFPSALAEIEQQVESGQIEIAKVRLQEVAQHMNRATKADLARFKLLNGDVVFKIQRINNTNDFERHKIVQRLYGEAREMGVKLDGTHKHRLAETLVALGEDEAALKVVDTLTDQPAVQRYTVIKQIIDRRLDAGDKPTTLVKMIDQFLGELKNEEDAVQRRRREIWAIGLKMQGLMDEGAPDEAISQLLRQIVRLKADGESDLAPLQVLLAKGYYAKAEFDLADQQFRSAQQELDDNDELNADVLVGQARIMIDRSRDYQNAMDLFAQAHRQYPSSRAFWDSVVGMGVCNAWMGYHVEAIKHFGEAVALLNEMPRRAESKIVHLANIARSQHGLHDDKQDHLMALQYLALLRRLFPEGLIADDQLMFAMTHERAARKLLEDAKKKPSKAGKKLANREAWDHFNKSAGHYRQHEMQIRIKSPGAARQSLWHAAVNYDSANEWDDAIAMYQQYIKAGDETPKQVEAIGKLGLAYMAQKDYDAALEQFRLLDTSHPRSNVTHNILVSMARCYMAKSEPDIAKSVLVRVVSDHDQIRPESIVFRDALKELGRMHYRLGEYAHAIERLDQAVKRYGDTPDGPSLSFLLADAYRKSVPLIEDSVANAVSEIARAKLVAERASRLEKARTLFDRVVTDLRQRDQKSLSNLERLQLRNAYFYRADCAFDLGQYENSIALYDDAANRFSEHPSSLMALVQIVNANCELGNVQAAKVANRRAREQLKRIPEEAFEDESLPMTRQHWQDWLRWADELDLFSSKQAIATGQ